MSVGGRRAPSNAPPCGGLVADLYFFILRDYTQFNANSYNCDTIEATMHSFLIYCEYYTHFSAVLRLYPRKCCVRVPFKIYFETYSILVSI